MEKALRRSRAIDTEGLCIVAGEKVWQIRVDLLFLDHDGNLVDCASIAAITALLHFRRPDVTVSGEEVTIVSGMGFGELKQCAKSQVTFVAPCRSKKSSALEYSPYTNLYHILVLRQRVCCH